MGPVGAQRRPGSSSVMRFWASLLGLMAGREVAEDLGFPALDGPRQVQELGGAGGPRQLVGGIELGVGLLEGGVIHEYERAA